MRSCLHEHREGRVLYWITINPANEKQEKDLAASVAAQISRLQAGRRDANTGR
jgi:hypothetical protein